MSKHTKRRKKVKRSTQKRARSRAAKKGWVTRRAHKREKQSKAKLPPGLRELIEQRIDREEGRELKRVQAVGKKLAELEAERVKLEKQRLRLEKREKRAIQKPEAVILDASIERVIESHIESGEWEDSDETRILGRLFAINRLDPIEFDDEVQRIADEPDYEDWSVHDIYELWFYGEVA